jgi:hypothetical protein
MLTNGKYDDLASQDQTERVERRTRFYGFRASVFGLFSAAFLLAYLFQRDPRYAYVCILLSLYAGLSFWLWKRNRNP